MTQSRHDTPPTSPLLPPEAHHHRRLTAPARTISPPSSVSGFGPRSPAPPL